MATFNQATDAAEKIRIFYGSRRPWKEVISDVKAVRKRDVFDNCSPYEGSVWCVLIRISRQPPLKYPFPTNLGKVRVVSRIAP